MSSSTKNSKRSRAGPQSAVAFALVVLAQLAATATRRDPPARLERKIGLTRRLYRLGLGRADILSLYAFIDWVLALPEALEEDYHRSIQAIEEAEHMQYVTTAERIGIKKGHQEGLQQGLEQGLEQGLHQGLESERALVMRLVRRRFGPEVAERSAPLLARVVVPEVLELLGEAVLDCADGEVWLTALRARVDVP